MVLVVVFALMIFVIAQQVLTIALDETEQSRNALINEVIELTADIETAQQSKERLGSAVERLEERLQNNNDQLETREMSWH